MGPDKFQNITTILFDLDNTLINSRTADHIACEQVFHYLLTDGVRRSVARDAVDKFRSALPLIPSPDVTWLLLKMKGALGPARAPRAPSTAQLFKETRSKNLRPVPGLEDLLLGLRGRYKLGLVAPYGDRARDEIEATGIGAFFDAIVVGEGSSLSREVFESAFRRLDVASMECAMVCSALGKSYCGVTVLVTSPGREECDGVPDFAIRDLRQLPDLLPERKGFVSLCQDRRLGFFHSLRDEGWTSIG